MSMGLINAPIKLTKTIYNLFIDMPGKGVEVSLDNVIIHNNSVEEQFKLPKKMFTYLHKHAFHFKLKKCSFPHKTTTFLGFNITLESICIVIPRWTVTRNGQSLSLYNRYSYSLVLYSVITIMWKHLVLLLSFCTH